MRTADCVEKFGYIVHVNVPAYLVGPRAVAKSTAVYQDDPVLIGKRELRSKRVEPHPKVPCTKRAASPSPYTSK